MSTTVFPSSRGEGGRSGSAQPASLDRDAARAPQDVCVLIVEDEWLVSMEIEGVLGDAGYDVAGTAVTADEAVRMVEMHRPDLVLMDIRLQGRRDGIQAAIEINRRFGLRCLFVSAHADVGTRERAAAANPLGWLSKPFSGPQLILALEAALRRLR